MKTPARSPGMPGPGPETFPDLVICEHCDSVYHRLALAPGEALRCESCGAVLYRAPRLEIHGWLALTLAAAIVFVIANVYPIVHISRQGLHNEATLWQAVTALAHGSAAPIALPAASFIILVPGAQIVLLLWILAHACAGRRAPGFAHLMRLLLVLRPWSMIEVGMLGILVSIIKLSSLAHIIPGVGLWATAALMVLITMIVNRDIHGLWHVTRCGPAAAGAGA